MIPLHFCAKPQDHYVASERPSNQWATRLCIRQLKSACQRDASFLIFSRGHTNSCWDILEVIDNDRVSGPCIRLET